MDFMGFFTIVLHRPTNHTRQVIGFLECFGSLVLYFVYKEAFMGREVIFTEKAPAAIGPYSQGISWQGTIYCAGQIPLDPATGKLVSGDIQAQAKRVIKNLKAVLEAAGSDLGKVLRLDVYLTDMNLFPQVNEYLAAIFKEDPPARATVEVSGLPMGAQIEMAAIAAK
jgi:reactive intermediate/imine deaminase